MKLFYFNPNGYGEQAFVCAESKEEAIRFLRNAPIQYSPGYQERFIEDMIAERGDYAINEFEPGHVIFSEIA